MACVLSKLNKAVIRYRIVSYNKEVSSKDELVFENTIEELAPYLHKIEHIIDKDKDVFGYPTTVVSLSDKQWNYFNEVYCLLVKIYKDKEARMRCSEHLRRFNELTNNSETDLIEMLKEILNSLEKENEPSASYRLLD